MKKIKALLTFFLFAMTSFVFFVSFADFALAGSCYCKGGSSGSSCMGEFIYDAEKTIINDSQDCDTLKSINDYTSCVYYTDDACKTIGETSCGTSKCSTGQFCKNSICLTKTDIGCAGPTDSKCNNYGGVGICKDDKMCYLDAIALEKYKQTPTLGGIKLDVEIKKPTIAISVPKLSFSDVQKNLVEEGTDVYLYLPWIGEYLTAVYKFLISIGSIVGVVMLIIQGAKIILSAGGEQKNAAFKRITQILIGLALAWGSYAILYNINPDLVQFKALKIKYIVGEPLQDAIDKGEPEQLGTQAKAPKGLQDTTYDAIFKKYGTQYGVDWRILKAMAFTESSLDAGLTNKYGFQGLFQFKKETCPTSLGSKCNNLLDPDNNTQAGAIMLKGNINNIKKYCPNASNDVLFTLMYMAHNSGSGAVNCATHDKCKIQTEKGKTPTEISSGGGCSLDKIKSGINAFWNNHWKRIFVTNRGERTYNVSVKTAQTMTSLVNSLPQ